MVRCASDTFLSYLQPLLRSEPQDVNTSCSKAEESILKTGKHRSGSKVVMKHRFGAQVLLELLAVQIEHTGVNSVPKSRQDRPAAGSERSALRSTLLDVKAGLCPSCKAFSADDVPPRFRVKVLPKTSFVARNPLNASRSTVSQR